MTQEREQELIQKYGEEVFFSAIEQFTELEARKEKAAKILENEIIKQKINYEDHNKLTGSNKRFDEESAIQQHIDKFDAEELAIIKKFGHKEEKEETKDLTTEEKIAQEKENFVDVGSEQAKAEKGEQVQEKSTSEKFAEQKEDLKTERAKFLAEMQAAREQNRTRERERER